MLARSALGVPFAQRVGEEGREHRRPAIELRIGLPLSSEVLNGQAQIRIDDRQTTIPRLSGSDEPEDLALLRDEDGH